MNEVIQPLRFYDNADYRLVNRHSLLNYFNFVPLIVDRKYLVPFQVDCVKTSLTENPLTTADLINYRTGATVNLLNHLVFTFKVDNILAPQRLYIQYLSNSTLSNLPYGVYYIHLVNAEGEWWSELFKIGSYTNTVTLEYTNATSFSGVLNPQKTLMKAMYEGRTFDAGEYSKHSEGYKDKDNFDKYTYKRFDKLRTLWIRGDSNVADLIELIQLCDTVYLTDETGKRSEIEIMETAPETVSRGNYMDILAKYRIKDNSIISVNTTPSYNLFYQAPVATPSGLTFDGDALTFDGNTLTFDE